MRFFAFTVAAFASFLGLNSPILAQDETAPISEYGELPKVERAVISPSGRRIAFVTTIKGKRALVAIEDQERVIQSVGVGEMKIRDLEWIGDDRVLIVSSQTEKLYGFTTDKAEFYVGRVIPVSPGVEAGIIFGNKRNLADVIRGRHGIRQIDGRWYGFYGAIELVKGSRRQYEFRHARPFLYRVDFQTFETKRLATSAEYNVYRDWLIGADGNIAVTFQANDETGKWSLKNGTGKVIAKGDNNTGRIGLVGLNYDGTGVILAEAIEGISDYREYSLASGEAKPFLADVAFDRLYFSPQTGHLMGYLSEGANPKPVFKNPDHEKAASKVRRAFAKFEMNMIDWTDDFSNMIVRTSGNQDSGTWYAVDIESLRANAIAYEREIGPDQVGPITKFEYEAADGLKLDGILTLPPGKKPENLPVIMLPHGGPHAHDEPTFDWWAQAFASRGYAVFQPNFRGSTNRSQAFKVAGYGQWGRAMQTDISDGLKALADSGIVDRKRACIAGASYGGYAALAGVTLQQGIYRCAVAVAPVSDIRQMYREDYRASGNDKTTKTALREQLGDPDTWDEVSPLRHAEKADAPIMLIHGKDDIVVPYGHSTKMADKLKDYKKPYEMVTLDGEDHWLSLSETRRTMLESALKFAQKHNPAD